MARARGANAQVALAFETDYGSPPASGFVKTPVVSINLGDEQPLEPSNLLGFGRDPQQPSRGPVDNTGNAVVPLCARNFGLWLRLLLGAPTTAQGLKARGGYTFSAQPDAASTITVNGQAFTFVSGTPAANEIRIGGTLKDTVANAVRVLNGSAVNGVAAATYRASPSGRAVEIVHDALGVSGNSFTLAAGSGSNATVSAATLAGGAATGGYQHTFVSGAQSLPSASIEIGNPEVPNWAMNAGVVGDTLSIPMQRSGSLDATLNLIAQGEYPDVVTRAGTPSELDVAKFNQFSGLVRHNGVPIADLVSGEITLSNGVDAVPGLRGDGRITGADAGMLAVGFRIGVRFSDRTFHAIAESGEGIELEATWYIPGTSWSLTIIEHRVYLPKAKTPITGPGGIQADYAGQASEHPTLGRTATFILNNDVSAY